ncbi:MAG: hypothetical protein A3F46_09090 [Legionellales bacterium RIFCSPHIGHO2_12_FULL_42_9]|nr:MAG: hypothetical protein A3F46_09090 [Legionellales bacterium RIFCSPHIGHO2_12_FULL_42_9]
MNTMSFVNEKEHQVIEKPGAQLAFIREKRGYTPEYVAGKLHLRKCIIEFLEADVYDQLPQAVFVKGYIRAYAKFLGVDAEPLITLFANSFVEERKSERTLWQSRREPSINERLVRWITALIVLAGILALTVWWQKNNNFSAAISHHIKSNGVKTSQKPTETYLAEVSKIQSLFKTEESTKTTSTINEAPGANGD